MLCTLIGFCIVYLVISFIYYSKGKPKFKDYDADVTHNNNKKALCSHLVQKLIIGLVVGVVFSFGIGIYRINIDTKSIVYTIQPSDWLFRRSDTTYITKFMRDDNSYTIAYTIWTPLRWQDKYIDSKTSNIYFNYLEGEVGGDNLPYISMETGKYSEAAIGLWYIRMSPVKDNYTFILPPV